MKLMSDANNSDGTFLKGTDASAVAIQPNGSANRNDLNTAGVEDWRELARRIEKEKDSKVMIDLIQQLIVRLDAENGGRKSSSRDE